MLTSSVLRTRFQRALALLLAATLMALAGTACAPSAQEQAQEGPVGNASGLPIPRWVSTRSNPINVRVGPGTQYEVAWTFLVSGVPVEITQEFDTWRRIRDVDGDEGWVHQNLLVGNRAGYAAPLIANGEVAMHASASDESGVRARLAAGVRMTINECDGAWCAVAATQSSDRHTFSGWVRQEEIWGVYPDEVFD